MTSTRLASSGFSDNKGFGWGAQSRGLIKPGLGHCYLTLTSKGPDDKKQLKQRQKWTFCILGQWVYPRFTQICGQILSITVKTVSNTILVAFRNVKSEKVSLPVNVRRSKIVGA